MSAVQAVIEFNRPTIAFIQCYTRVQYDRAERFINWMEAEGLVSAPDDGGGRKVIANLDIAV